MGGWKWWESGKGEGPSVERRERKEREPHLWTRLNTPTSPLLPLFPRPPFALRTSSEGASKASEAGGEAAADVKRFLNRLLGLPIVEQNLLFSYFFAALASEIRLAKAEGKYSEGLSGELRGERMLCLAWCAARAPELWQTAHSLSLSLSSSLAYCPPSSPFTPAPLTRSKPPFPPPLLAPHPRPVRAVGAPPLHTQHMD